MSETATRVCSICTTRKPLDEFPDVPAGASPPGKRHQCHPCYDAWDVKCRQSAAAARDLNRWVAGEQAKAQGASTHHTPPRFR